MRLLEPIQGLKIAQGHILSHIIFFVISLTLSTKDMYDAKGDLIYNKTIE